jgi:CPA2 family monovalent cation:H+ antiporter-2
MTALATSLPTSTAGGASLLANLAIILCVAAVTTVLFQRIRQPVILGYLLAGLIVGPHLPVPLVADEGVAHTLSELGVILLMFALGLEFSLRKLARVAAEAGLIAAIQCGLMLWLGYIVGRAFGWTRLESLFAGAAIAISSTTIIVKAFDEQGIKGRITELVFGILIVEDLVAILLLAILTAFASGAGVSAGQLAHIAGRLGGLLAILLVAGLLIVPRLMRMVVRVGRPETIVVASVGICFAFAIIAEKLGYSVALGAFLGGTLVAESGEGHRIEPLVAPVRDVFAAVFFVAVGMQIDPRLLAQHAGAIVVMTVVVVGGKIVGVTAGAFLAGRDVRTSIQAGMSMAQIGEFSFIIAGVGTTLGATRHFLYPIAVAVSAITTLVTPWLIRAAAPVAAAVDRRMPRAMQTYATLYGSWVQHLRASNKDGRRASVVRRTAGLLLADMTVIGAIVVSVAGAMPEVTGVLARRMGMSVVPARLTLLVGAIIAVLPFLYGAIRLARKLGAALAAQAIPARGDGVDLAAAPRRALVVGLQLAILALVGIPFLAAIQPFVPLAPTAIVLGLALALLAIPFWRSATNLEAHVRAGSQVITELLAAEARSADHGAQALEGARHLIPGLGEPVIVELRAPSGAIGQTLKTLNLRGLTGASVVALRPAGGTAVVPTGDETLAAGDVLVLAGATEAVTSARAMLEPPQT